MSNTTTNNKFTATLVTEETKSAVVALRNETNLSEKELMTIIVNVAIANKNQVTTQAVKAIADNNVAKEARKKLAYEALKAKMKDARDGSKKPATPAPAKPVIKPAPAPVKTGKPAPAAV